MNRRTRSALENFVSNTSDKLDGVLNLRSFKVFSYYTSDHFFNYQFEKSINQFIDISFDSFVKSLNVCFEKSIN